jgi:hypothetical protein
MEVDKKYVVVHARRFQNTSHPIIKLTIRYSEHETLDIFLPWRFSDLFTPGGIDIINTSSVRSIFAFKGLDESRQYFVLGFE